MNRILNPETLTSHGNIEGRKTVCEILEAGLNAGDPYVKTMQMLHLEHGLLTVGNPAFEPIGSPRPGNEIYDLEHDIDRIFLFAAGKGMLRVAKALEEVLEDYLTGGCALVKYGDTEDLHKIEVLYGGHPVPDENCVKGCKYMLDMIENLQLTNRDLVFTIVGNGIGSLMTYPAEGISLQAISDMIHFMQIEKGVSTAELSFVRNQVDRIKGGRLTRKLYPAKMVHILAIDCNYGNTGIPGYAGLMKANVWIHTMPDISSKEKAIAVLKKWDAWERVDPSIRTHLLSPESGEEVLRQPEFEGMDCKIYGVMPDDSGPLPSAMEQAKKLGYEPHLINRGHGLESSVMGKFFGLLGKSVLRDGQPFKSPCALFFTGEMLVTVGNNDGIGGRNQECALSAATVIAGNPHIVIGCVDTDGTDGPGGPFHEDAIKLGISALSGGIVDGYTILEADRISLDVTSHLKKHATSTALWQLGDAIWATQNISVQDLVVILVTSPKS